MRRLSSRGGSTAKDQIKQYLLDLLQNAGLQDEVLLAELDPSEINRSINEVQSSSSTQIQKTIDATIRRIRKQSCRDNVAWRATETHSWTKLVADNEDSCCTAPRQATSISNLAESESGDASRMRWAKTASVTDNEGG